MVFPGRVAVGASAGQDAGRSGASLLKRQEAVRDCLSVLRASARDFQWAWSALARRDAPGHQDVPDQRQDVPDRRQDPPRQAAWHLAERPPGPQAAPREAHLVFPQLREERGESGRPPAQWLPAQQVLPLAAQPRPVSERRAWTPLEPGLPVQPEGLP
jgi:hypothetical protein